MVKQIMATQTYQTTPPHRRPKYYPEHPETLRHTDTTGLGHGGNPARNKIVLFKATYYEKNELFELARIQRVSASYLIRQALEKEFPEIFVNTNHNIKPPAKPNKQRKPRDKTVIATSLVDNKQTIILPTRNE